MQFHALTIAAVERDTADAIRVRFAVPPALRAQFAFRPGQHVTLRSRIDGEELRRTYSICSAMADNDLAVTIKRVRDGAFSNHANDTFRTGDAVDVMPPSGSFVLPPYAGQPRSFLGIAAGSGITPLFAMLREVLEREPASRFLLLYGNRHPASILLREELAALKSRHMDRFAVVHLLSRAGDGDEGGAPLSGRIDADRVAQLVPRLVPARSLDAAFLCGPGSMIASATAGLEALGLPRARIHSEYFQPAAAPVSRPRRPTPPAGDVAATGTELTLTLDGVRHEVRMRSDETLLEAALRAGLGAPYSCRAGMCCTCRARLVEGTVDMDANYSLEAWEIERGYVLSCQARPRSARVAIDYDPL